MPTKKKAMPKKSTRRPRLPRMPIREYKDLTPYFLHLAQKLAQCGPETHFITKLLQRVYCAGFTNGAISSRKAFTDWKPPSNYVNAAEDIQEAADDFAWEMRAIHRSPLSPEHLN